MRDISYPPIIASAKVLFRALGLRFQLSGTEHVPSTGGALLAINHVGYVDFVLAGYAAQPSGRLVRFMAKKEVFDHPVGGPVMRSMHHIAVDRGNGIGSLKDALRYLKDGEIVGIFPEATISRSFEIKEIKNGAVRIAAQAKVPLIPVVLFGTQRLMTKGHARSLRGRKTIAIRVGEAMQVTGKDADAETEELHRRLRALLDETIASYPDAEKLPGSWWIPSRLGGSAPTLEEAERLDVEEKRERAARRAGRRADK